MKYESNFEYLDLRNRNKLVCDDKHKKSNHNNRIQKSTYKNTIQRRFNVIKARINLINSRCTVFNFDPKLSQ